MRSPKPELDYFQTHCFRTETEKKRVCAFVCVYTERGVLDFVLFGFPRKKKMNSRSFKFKCEVRLCV